MNRDETSALNADISTYLTDVSLYPENIDISGYDFRRFCRERRVSALALANHIGSSVRYVVSLERSRKPIEPWIVRTVKEIAR